MRLNIHQRGRAVSVLVVSITFAGVAAVAAQAPQPLPKTPPPQTMARAAELEVALPSARKVLDRHVEAIGGRKAVLSHSSSHATGTISVPSQGITGTLDVYSAARPNRTVLKINLGGVGDIAEGYDGVTAWSMSPLTGAMVLQGKQFDDRKFDSEFYGELHDDARYESMKTVEKALFEGRPCYKVSLVRRGGGEDFEFYDVETGLKAGSINTRETSMGSVTTTSVETDYKKFGNVLQPTTLRQSVIGIQQVFTVSTVEYDKVDPSVFEPPAQIKALIK